eukprot:752190-Hanusia_phi.AAC.5
MNRTVVKRNGYGKSKAARLGGGVDRTSMQGNSSATCWCDERRGKEEGTGKGGQLLNHRPRDSGYVSSHLRVGGPHDRSAYHLPSAQADDEGVVQFVSGNDDSETLHHGSQGSGFLSDMWKDIASIGPRLAEVGWTWHGDLFERGYHSSTPPALAQDSEDERVKSDSDISKNTTVSATSLDLMNEKERNNKHDAKSKGKERKERSRMKSSTIPMELTYKKDEVLPVCSGDVRSEIDRSAMFSVAQLGHADRMTPSQADCAKDRI